VFWKVMGIPLNSTLTFETGLGRCAVRWSELGITAVLLPSWSIPEAPTNVDPTEAPAFVQRTIEGITTLLAGGADDLRDIPLDDRGIDHFRRTVYAETRTIDRGTTRSYGEIARAIGRPDQAREVGAALARNPFSIVVPCHRVVAANGALTGFSAPGGLTTKRRMLEIEGAPGYGQQTLFG
jgi:methylated-DNA-[protein]-cysteine S-methyltransferase